MYSDLNEFGSNLEPAHADYAKVVDDADDLRWLDQYGSMDDLFGGADSDSDDSGADDVESSSETHVEVEW